MSDWISVDDRLPELSYQVVLATLRRFDGTRYVDAVLFYRFRGESMFPVGSQKNPVTHWMPLPEPAK